MGQTELNRRDFLKSSASVSAAAILANGVAQNYAYAAGGASDRIKVGLVGCGGRGTGAWHNCMTGNDNVVLWAVGDLWEKKAKDNSRLKPESGKEAFYNIGDRAFWGFDNYKKVIDSGVDMVILATPPGFRPLHFTYAVEKGKHVFVEKPVCVDPVGYRKILAAAEMAASKKLSIVAGTQRRHQACYVETMKKVLAGEIGQVVAAQAYWIGGPPDPTGPLGNNRPDGCSDIEWQCNKWYRYSWTCGDHIVEQHVHNIDICQWAIGANPVSCIGIGGRQTRKDEGNIFDHHAVEFEYPNSVQMSSYCSQFAGKPSGRVSEFLVGTKGTCNPRGVIELYDGKKWTYEAKPTDKDPYVQEHIDLMASITGKGPYLNETKQVADSCMVAVLGRMATYTGRELKWSWAVNKCELDLTPPKVEIGASYTPPPVAMPGNAEQIQQLLGGEAPPAGGGKKKKA